MDYSEQDRIYREFETFIETTYPEFFKDQQYGGFSIGVGWFGVVKQLFADIHSHVTQQRLEGNSINITVAQIKEKFGGLRVYIDGADDTIANLIRQAEIDCSNCCEVCGQPATNTSTGWISRLCDTHHKERQVQIGR